MHGNHVPTNYARFPFPFDSLRYTVQKKWGFIQERKTSGNLIQAYGLDSLFPFE